MDKSKLRWRGTDPKNPTVPIRQSSNPQLTVDVVRQKLAETTDDRLREILQEHLKQAEQALIDSGTEPGPKN